MRSIGHVQGESKARTFSDYLYVTGIKNDLENEGGDKWSVWVHDEDMLERACALLNEFAASPGDPKYGTAARHAEDLRERSRVEEENYRRRTRDARTLFPPVGHSGPAWFTKFLIAVSALVFILSRFGTDFGTVSSLSIGDYVVVGPIWERFAGLVEVRHGQVWRLFTPMFIHMTFMHIFFNMLWLLDLGGMVEGREGTGKLARLVLVISALSNVAQYIVSGPSFGGMSGVVYGLLGYVWMRGKHDPGSGLGLHPTTVTMMLIWFVVCFTGLLGPIANTVHAVGLGVGVFWGWFISVRRAI